MEKTRQPMLVTSLMTPVSSLFSLMPQAVLSSLGGVELLYPLLEQVDLPVKQREVQERQGERKLSQQETGNLASPSDHWKAIPFVWWFDGETAFLVAVSRLL